MQTSQTSFITGAGQGHSISRHDTEDKGRYDTHGWAFVSFQFIFSSDALKPAGESQGLNGNQPGFGQTCLRVLFCIHKKKLQQRFFLMFCADL